MLSDVKTCMQDSSYLGLRKVSLPSLDDKLKHVAHQGFDMRTSMFDMLQLVDVIGKIEPTSKRACKTAGISVYAR